MKVLFTSKNLIGDALNISPAFRAWLKQQKGPVDIWMQTLPDHVAPLYEGMVRDLINSPVTIHTFGLCFERPNGIKFDFEHTFNVSNVVDDKGNITAPGAFQLSDQKKQHLATSYADLLGVQIGNEKLDLKPTYIPDRNEPGWSWDKFEDPAPQAISPILVSMFSASCTSRDPKIGVPNKMVPFDKWIPMLQFLHEKFPNTPIRALGASTDFLLATCHGDVQLGVEAMFGIPLNRLALIMKKAKLLVTIDNGMAHLAATQETPTFEMYPVALGSHYILPVGNPNLVWVHMNPVTVKPEYLLNGLQYAVKKFENTIWRKQ